MSLTVTIRALVRRSGRSVEHRRPRTVALSGPPGRTTPRHRVIAGGDRWIRRCKVIGSPWNGHGAVTVPAVGLRAMPCSWFLGLVMTTYSVGDIGSQLALTSGLRAQGFRVDVEGPKSEPLVRVSHGVDQASALDERVYAQVPWASIVTTARANESTLEGSGKRLSHAKQPRHRVQE